MSSLEIKITVLSGVSAGDVFRYELEEATPLVIGRLPECNMVLQDPKASRNHAKITLLSDELYLEDLGSSHGTQHMGFTVNPGADNRRKLSSGDEFKVGESIFRVSFLKIETKAISSLIDDQSGSKFQKKYLIIALLVIVVLVLAFLPSGSKPLLPKQYSNVALLLPQKRVTGYWIASKVKSHRDESHIDKATFEILASDQLIEFDYISQSSLKVFVDGAEIAVLPASPGSWEHCAIVIRDALSGVQRQLVIDNLGFPNTKGKLPQWGVYNVRSRALDRSEQQRGVDKALSATLAESSTIDKRPGSLYDVSRQFYLLVLEMIHELKFSAALVSIDPEMKFPETNDLVLRLELIQRERLGDLSSETLNGHLAEVVKMVAGLDSEVWRRVDSRINQVNYAKEIENYLDAYDNLKAVMRIVPDKFDERNINAEQLFNDEDIIPESLRRDPVRYRRSLAK